MSYSLTPTDWSSNILNKTIAHVKSSLRSITVPLSSSLTEKKTEWNDNYATALNLIDKIYLFSNYAQVNLFLKKSPFLIPLLLEAYSEIRNIFSNSVLLGINIETDENGENEKLYIIISSDLPNSYELLDELDEAWWLDALPRAKSLMNIDLEY